jgi:hypothetical protein
MKLDKSGLVPVIPRISPPALFLVSRVVVGGSLDRLARLGVDPNGNPAKNTIGDSTTEQDVVENRVGGLGLTSKNAVLGVGSQGLFVSAVWGNLLNTGDKRLIKEELADVRDSAARN